MTFINAACCERCWCIREGEWEHMPTDPELQRLVNLRQPVMIRPDIDFRVETCAFCGWPTFCGIFVRTEEVKGLA